ncbi:hypothetical protein N3P09_04665, partial [Treponema pallidum]
LALRLSIVPSLALWIPNAALFFTALILSMRKSAV